MQNHSYENDFDLHENETACRTHFHMKGLALRLVLKQRHKRTRKWPIGFVSTTLHDWLKKLAPLSTNRDSYASASLDYVKFLLVYCTVCGL